MKANAEAIGMECEITTKRTRIPYTFMAWDRRVLPLYPDGRGEEFPAFFTKRAGVDKSLIDWMVPLFDRGVKGNALADILLQFHSKEYFKRYIRYERDEGSKRRLNPSYTYDMFGEFSKE